MKLLVLAPQRRLHREQAIDVLWPDRAPAAAANNLHQALHVARRSSAAATGCGSTTTCSSSAPASRSSSTPRPSATTPSRRSAPATATPPARRSVSTPGPLLPEDLYEDWTDPARAEAERLHDELEALAGGVHREQRDNLPTELTAFIGREAELTDIGQLLRRGPLLTIAGPAGCGKTRLAVETAARRRDDFVDGVWLVELAPLSRPEMVADAVAAVFGLKLRRRTAETVLVETLASREALIVLDNCEHLVGACAQLAEALLRGCPALQVLATSREALEVNGEVVWRVPSLSDAEAVHLFTDRASAAQPGFALTSANSAAVSEICRRLDGVPLAIELAAARVGSLPPGEIAHRLDRSFRLLRQGQRTSVTRQQTLEAALDWSYQLLDADEAMLLRRLAVFAGGFGLDAAEGIGADDDLPAGEIVDALVRLVGKSLVVAEEVAGPPRYRLLEMVRQYARERLGDAGEAETMLERHARWYEALATELTGGAAPRAARRRDRQPARGPALAALPRRAGGAATRSRARRLVAAARAAGRGARMVRRVDRPRRRPRPPPARCCAPCRSPSAAATWPRAAASPSAASRSTASAATGPARRRRSRCSGCSRGCAAATSARASLLDEAIDEARIGRSTVAEANASHALGLLTISTGDLDHARALLERASSCSSAARAARTPRSSSRRPASSRSRTRPGSCRRSRRSCSGRSTGRAPPPRTCASASPSSRAWRATRRARRPACATRSRPYAPPATRPARRRRSPRSGACGR